MSKLQPYIVPSVTDAQHARMEALMDEMAAVAPDDAGIRISHVLHAGCYARTAFVPAGVLFVSNQVMVPTVVVISGDCLLTDTDKAVRIQGYEVLAGAQRRQAVFRTLKDTYITAFFATNAKTVAEAEREAVADPSRLLRVSEEE